MQVADLPIDVELVLRAVVVPAEAVLGPFSGPGEDYVALLLQDTPQVPMDEGVNVAEAETGSFDEACGLLATLIIDELLVEETRPARLVFENRSALTVVESILESTGIRMVLEPPPDGSGTIQRCAALFSPLPGDGEEEIDPLLPNYLAGLRESHQQALSLQQSNPWRLTTRFDPFLFSIRGQRIDWPCISLLEGPRGNLLAFLRSEEELWMLADRRRAVPEDTQFWEVALGPASGLHANRRAFLRRSGISVGPDGTVAAVAFVDGRRVDRLPVPLPRPYLAAMKALERTTDEQVDQGRWEVQVEVAGERFEVELTWPNGLEPPTPGEWRRRGVLPHRMLDVMAEFLAGVLAQQDAQQEGGPTPHRGKVSAASLDGLIERLCAKARPAKVEADVLAARAMRSHGRTRRRLIVAALRRSPDSIVAWLMNADLAPSVEERERCLQGAMAAAERLAGGAQDRADGWIGVDGGMAIFAVVEMAEFQRQEGRLEETEALLAKFQERNPSATVLRDMLTLVKLLRGDVAGAATLVLPPHRKEPALNGPECWLRAFTAYRLWGDVTATRDLTEVAITLAPITGVALVKRQLATSEALEAEVGARRFGLNVSLADDLRPLVDEHPGFIRIVREIFDHNADVEPSSPPPPHKRFKSRPKRR